MWVALLCVNVRINDVGFHMQDVCHQLIDLSPGDISHYYSIPRNVVFLQKASGRKRGD